MWRYRRFWGRLLIVSLILSWQADASGAQPEAGSAKKATPDSMHSAAEYDAQVRQFFVRNCVDCHGPEKPKGEFRLDNLSMDFTNDTCRTQWVNLRKRIKSGEMPPKGRPRPPEVEVNHLVSWIEKQLTLTDEAQHGAQGRAVLRRLNRVEYENTIRDLLGVEVELQELLPADSSSSGFDNVGDALHVSSFLMDRYLEAADKALNLAIVNLPQPPLLKKRYHLKDTHQVKATTESVFRPLDNDETVMFSSSHWQSVTLSPFYPSDRGRYRFRISAAGFQSHQQPVTFRIDAGPMLMATKNHMVGYFDAPPDKAAVTEFIDHLEARSTIRIAPFGLASSQEVHKIGADKYTGTGLKVDWIEVEGPLHEFWPPESHRRIFGDLPQESARDREDSRLVHVVSKAPIPDATRILINFCRRAFRRTVTDGDIKPLLTLVEQKLAEGYSFEQAVRVALKGALVSPEFLFLYERPGILDDFALASRLSYFIWSTMPDDELLALASKRQLGSPQVLRQQVERLLKSKKAAALTENFVGQWLGLREIDSTEPDRQLYPEYDDMLRAAMVQETHLFFEEVLNHDLSLTNFIASDFAMVNERLAKHYGIPGVQGHAFRRVPLPADCHRGGVMTMASVLKVTANGTSTSPVVRGSWVLDRILGSPPSPPPAGVPAVEPDIRGATTIREQLAKHREAEACASCHRQIDPPGFALESYDVIGGWRENYRSVGNGEPVSVAGRRMPYLKGKRIDPSDVLLDGRRFQNIDEFKQLLLADKDQLARALTIRLATYATGAVPRAADRAEIEAIVGQVSDSNYGLRTLIHAVIQSDLFRAK